MDAQPLSVSNASPEDLAARTTAEQSGDPYIVYRDSDNAQHIVMLGEDRPSLTIGRRDEADLALPWDRQVSRLHAELERRGGEWTITDDGLSQNGTFVNELRLYGRRRLQDGDLVRVGRTVIAFCIPATAQDGEVTLLPGKLPAAPVFSEQQHRLLTALCRPLAKDPNAPTPSDEVIAAETGIAVDTVSTELEHLARSFGIEDMPEPLWREEIATIAMRAGLVGDMGA